MNVQKVRRALWSGAILGAVALCGHDVLAADAPTTAPTVPPQTGRYDGWYQWRGPEQNGVSREKNLPDNWSPEGENLIWTAPVGGMSSPIVMNGHLYTYARDAEVSADFGQTLAPGPQTQESLVCLDANDGKEAWRFNEPMYQTDVPFHRLGWSNPVGDPTTGRVYGLGVQGLLVCLDGKTGKPVWKHEMTERYGFITTFGGRTPSPAIDEDLVVVGGVAFGWGDNARAQHRLFAFDKNNGELRWTAGCGGLPVDAPYNTPVFTVINGERVVILAAGDGGIHCFQARTGKRVWAFRASLRGMNDSVVVDGNYVYVSHDLDNPDTTELGRVYCLDGATLEPGKPGQFGPAPIPQPKEVWRVTGRHPASNNGQAEGVPAGFPSATIAGDRLYVEDDTATVWAIDKKTGKVYWTKKCGTTGKASLVWGDDKLYVCEANGRYWVLKDAGTKAQVVAKVDIPEKFGREYAIFGSVAIDNGRVYVEGANKTYCIGDKTRHASGAVTIPPFPAEPPVEPNAQPAQVQVVPADAMLHPNEKLKLTARLYDAKGRYLGDAKPEQVKWEISQLTLPPPPVPPKPAAPAGQPAAGAPSVPAGASTGAGAPKAEVGDAARSQLAAAAATHPTVAPNAPTKVGNLKGEVDANGTFTAAAGPAQGGAVVATVGKLTGASRVRVLPALPWKLDFEHSPIGAPPLTWIGAGGKFAVVDLGGNKVLQKLTNFDLYYRARTYFGSVDMSNYSVESDVKVNDKVMNNLHAVPDVGIINSRYVLLLLGNDQKLQAISWPAAVPDQRQPSGSANSTVPFKWDAKKWYHLKLEVRPFGTGASMVVKVNGKAWPKDAPEPKEWQVSFEDKLPNNHGSPGLFGNSLVGQQKSEIYYDNILVTPNAPGGTAMKTAR